MDAKRAKAALERAEKATEGPYASATDEQMGARVRMTRTEPLWWGRGARNCLAVWPNKNGPYHEIFIGNGKTQEEGPSIQIMNDELDSLIRFLQDVRDGKPMENG